MFSKYINEDYETLNLKSNSTITRDILIETSQFIDIIDNLISLMREILLLTGIIVVLLLTDPIITFIIGIFLGFIIISFYLIFRKKISEKGRIVQFERERLFQWINETFGSILDIKIFNQYSHFYKLFANSVIRYEKQNLYMNFVSSLPKNFSRSNKYINCTFTYYCSCLLRQNTSFLFTIVNSISNCTS